MSAANVPAVYASALLALADEREKRAAVLHDCQELAKALANDATLLQALTSPRLGRARAKEAFRAALAGQAEPEVIDFVALLADRGRLAALPAILAEVERQVSAQAGRVAVKVTTAIPADAAVTTRILTALQTRYGAGVDASFHVDPDLIGGLRIQVGDTLIDATLRRKLSEVKSLMLSVSVAGATVS